jgi:predicted acylesterase/phospholipase RssA
MIPFRKNLAIAIDGGGIRGLIVTQALTALESHLGMPLHQRARLVVGTSTGSIIAAGIAAGLTGQEMTERYLRWARPSSQTRHVNGCSPSPVLDIPLNPCTTGCKPNSVTKRWAISGKPIRLPTW